MIYERSFASHPRSAQWHPTLNGDTVPRGVVINSSKKFWFVCETCKHDFISSLYDVCRERWCPYCFNKLCEDRACKICFDKSFASHPKSSYWHTNKNGDEVPRNTPKYSNKKYHFTCETCNHDFMKCLYSVTDGKWCPFCSNTNLCEDRECKVCFDKSFASHPKSLYWHPTKNGNHDSRSYFKYTTNMFWFICGTCEHEFIIRLVRVTIGSWCPYCTNKKLCEDLECKMCFNNSFASHPKSFCWHKDKNINHVPRSVAKHSNKRFYLVCDTCEQELYVPINRVSNGHWCGKCKNKTERKLHTTLKEAWPSTIHQFKQDWCMKKKRLPFDFCIPEKKVIIELDGRQHFRQVSNWTTPEVCLENDVFKQKCANENGYSVIRIIQEDVWFDRYDWCTKLQETIDGIHDGYCANVFLCENGEYDSRRAALIDAR